MNADPLQDILVRLALGPVRTLDQLAEELDVDRTLLEQMLLNLERAGYVLSARASCDLKCRGCDDQDLCRLIHSGRIWTITEKGTRAASPPR